MALCAPAVGLLIDNTKSRLGKFKPWLIFGGILNLCFALLLFFPPALNAASLELYICFSYLCWCMSYTLIDIPFLALIPSFGSNDRVRSNMSAIAKGCSVLGQNLVLFGTTPIILYFAGHGHSLNSGCLILFITIAAVFAISQLILITGISAWHSGWRRIGIKEGFGLVLNNDQLRLICAFSFMFPLLLNLIVNSLILRILPARFSAHEALTQILISCAAAELAAIVFFPRLVRLASRRVVFTASLSAILASFMLLLFFHLAGIGSAGLYITLLLILYISFGLVQVTLITMTADTVDYGEFKSGTRSEALIFAVQDSCAKLGFGLMPLFTVLPLQLRWFTSDPGFYVICALTALITILSVLLYLTFYKLNSPFYRQVLNNLQHLRSRDHSFAHGRFLLRYALDEKSVIVKLKASSIDEVITAMVQKLDEVHCLRSAKEFRDAIDRRMRQDQCGIASGIAIPHARSATVNRAAIAVAILDRPLDFHSADGRDCDLVFMLASPDDGHTHLSLLGKLSLILNEREFAARLRSSGSPAEVLERFVQCEKHITN